MNRVAYLFIAVIFITISAACGNQPAENTLFTDADIRSISAKTDEIMKREFPEGGPGAAIGIIYKGEFIHKKGYALGDLETGMSFSTTSPCYLGSVSKQFTTMAIMILQERGLLKYEDKLRSFFPDTPEEWDDITVWHLMTHTSGLIDIFKIAGGIEDLTNKMALQKNIEHKVLDFKTGEKYSYSNSGYIMLALIVEKASGQPFQEFVKENIFDPLGMNSSLVFDSSKPEIPGKVRGYRKADDTWELYDYNICTMGAGGFYSTIEDLFLWDQALYTEKLVSRKTLDEAFSVQVQRNESNGYGYAWVINEYKGMRRIGHTGSLRGFRTYLGRFPDQEFTIMILTNGSRTDRDDILDEILEVCFPAGAD